MRESKPQWTPGEWVARPMTPGEPDKSWEVVTRLHHPDGEDLGETAVAIYLTRSSARLLAGAKDLYAELEDAARTYEETANTLDAWAQQSREGGWSTHQVKANREAADALRRKAAGYRLALAKARGEEAPE